MICSCVTHKLTLVTRDPVQRKGTRHEVSKENSVIIQVTSGIVNHTSASLQPLNVQLSSCSSNSAPSSPTSGTTISFTVHTRYRLKDRIDTRCSDLQTQYASFDVPLAIVHPSDHVSTTSFCTCILHSSTPNANVALLQQTSVSRTASETTPLWLCSSYQHVFRLC